MELNEVKAGGYRWIRSRGSFGGGRKRLCGDELVVESNQLGVSCQRANKTTNAEDRPPAAPRRLSELHTVTLRDDAP